MKVVKTCQTVLKPPDAADRSQSQPIIYLQTGSEAVNKADKQEDH